MSHHHHLNEGFKAETLKKQIDPIEGLEDLFLGVQKERVNLGQCPVRRPVFLRTHGILKGSIKFEENIPKTYQHGIFAQAGKSLDVYTRFSSDLSDGRPDWMSTMGLGIKILGIPGEKVVSDDGHKTADLIFQNTSNFFAANASDFYYFTRASLEGWGSEWIAKNAPNTNALLDSMSKPIRSTLETQYWSVLPFRLGKKHYCKYIIKPGVSTFVEDPNTDDPDFLGKDLHARANAGRITLDLYLQIRPDESENGEAYLEEHFPLDDATVTWDEHESKIIKVAQLSFNKQNVEKQAVYGDWLAFNIGRVPEENHPVGTLAQARMKIYKASADYRREKNSQPVEEPTAIGKPKIESPKCPFPHHKQPEKPKALTKSEIDRITNVRIHPGIGVMRVGNSSKYYIGPEVMTPPVTNFGSTRDETGALKREAARFRVYGYDKHGNVVAEIQQSDNTNVEWNVHVVNKKADWFNFAQAMDIPSAKKLSVKRRNPAVQKRNELIINAGSTKIMGLSMKDSSFRMKGAFKGNSVYLGELRTDSVGRLLVLPGMGKSESPSGKPPIDMANANVSFNNATDWYDDICDGPVHAKVSINGHEFDADGAWVVAAPPNYAPDFIGWRTMNDLMRETFVKAGMMQLPQQISFTKHVLPILQRLTNLQWLNKGFSAKYGADSPMDFGDEKLLGKLSQVPLSSIYPDPYKELRRTIYNAFRPTNGKHLDKNAWPPIYGDDFGVGNNNKSDTFLRLPETYNYILKKWVAGDFKDDFGKISTPKTSLAELPISEQPDMLDQAAMHFCLADAFHPGCEMTWPMRHASMYRAPYRINERMMGSAPSYGSSLDQKKVLQIGGPLYEQSAGDLSKWMALPWQGDTAYCRSGYDKEYDPYIQTFWVARVPNFVLTEKDYQILCDTSKSKEERIAAFHNRPNWMRALIPLGGISEVMTHMVHHFGEMGIVEAKPRPSDKDMEWLPETIYVENLTEATEMAIEAQYEAFMKAAKDQGIDPLILESGWFKEEQENDFNVIRLGG